MLVLRDRIPAEVGLKHSVNYGSCNYCRNLRDRIPAEVGLKHELILQAQIAGQKLRDRIPAEVGLKPKQVLEIFSNQDLLETAFQQK